MLQEHTCFGTKKPDAITWKDGSAPHSVKLYLADNVYIEGDNWYGKLAYGEMSTEGDLPTNKQIMADWEAWFKKVSTFPTTIMKPIKGM